jgi:hypothetical protein
MEKIRSWLNVTTYWLSKLWLVGSLFQAGRKTYAGALYEFTYALVWSIFPFILGALTLYVTSDEPDKHFINLTVDTFRNGELLIYTISMLTPILYLVLHDPEQAEPFPHKLPISTLVTVIAVTCSALFALMKAHAIKDSDFVLSFSITLTALALLIRYLSLVYHRLRMPDVRERELRADQDRFLQRYSRHVGSPAPQVQPATDFAAAFARHVEEK